MNYRNRNITSLAIAGFIAALVIMPGCSSRPDVVLSPDKMTDLLVDIYKAESVIEYERSRYYSDSAKMLVKQSVYAAHDVTEAQVDTSYVWYGHHIDDYIKIHDDVIARLEGELTEATGNHIVYGEGDSINIWPGEQRYRLNNPLAQNISYDIPLDNTSNKGDNYQLQYNIITVGSQAPSLNTVIVAEYDNGKIEYKYAYSLNDEHVRMRFVADSTLMLNRLVASIQYNVPQGTTLYLDSVSMVRTRVQPSTYNMRYGQRVINNQRQQIPADSITGVTE